MNKPKTLLQRVQSRISMRRNELFDLERVVQHHYFKKEYWGEVYLDKWTLQHYKDTLKVTAASQKLDKQIFQVLLTQERNKFAGYFRSAYPRIGCSFREGSFS